MIVILIIGLLSTALYPVATGYFMRSRDASREVDISTLASSITSYAQENNYYPPPTSSGCISTGALSKYTNLLPKSPHSPTYNEGCGENGSYAYGVGPGNTSYILMARMEQYKGGNYTGSTLGMTGLITQDGWNNAQNIKQGSGSIYLFSKGYYLAGFSNPIHIPGMPVDGGWSDWVDIGLCSASCGGGTKPQSRTCDNPAPANGGASCPGPSGQSIPCNTHACPVNGSCATISNTCTTGTPSSYLPGSCGGFKTWTCNGTSGGTNASCNIPNAPCPINGGWSNWTDTSACSVTCGGGIKSQQRTCDNPAPLYGGTICTGPITQTVSCTMPPCITYSWTTSSWSACSTTCGGGTQSRTVVCKDSNNTTVSDTLCTTPKPSSSQSCNINPCPTSGPYSYSAWSACSASCGGGTQTRTQSCNYDSCYSPQATSQSCNTQACPTSGPYSYSAWSACSASCGGGTQTRTQSCNYDSCYSPQPTSQSCNMNVCPTNGHWVGQIDTQRVSDGTYTIACNATIGCSYDDIIGGGMCSPVGSSAVFYSPNSNYVEGKECR